MHPNRKKLPTLDKYYTKKDVVTLCLNELNIERYDCVIEPSAGTGAFFNEIKHTNKIGMDIQPECKGILKRNWLKYQISPDYEKVLIVGNPPFGAYHKISSAFITHSFQYDNVQTVAFILPNVYKKHTRQRILPDNWRIVSITELPRNSFIYNGKDYHLPTSFFVFDKSKGKDLRVNPDLYVETDDFTFGNKNDFDIFVFGASPRNITKEPTPNNRGYFLKSKIAVDKLIKKIKRVDWQGNSCANGGVYWLNKYEFLKQYISCHK